jgi:hypothetical protein
VFPLHDDCMPIPQSRCPVGRSVVSLAGVRKSVLRAGDKNELGIISYRYSSFVLNV